MSSTTVSVHSALLGGSVIAGIPSSPSSTLTVIPAARERISLLHHTPFGSFRYAACLRSQCSAQRDPSTADLGQRVLAHLLREDVTRVHAWVLSAPLRNHLQTLRVAGDVNLVVTLRLVLVP